MKVVIDERETALFAQCTQLIESNYTTELPTISKSVLTLGDISIRTDDDTEICIIERKSLADLLASLHDSRYEEQSYRLTHSSGIPLHNIVYLIEGDLKTLASDKIRKTVCSVITSLSLYKGFSVYRTFSLKETAELVVCMASKIARNTHKNISFASSETPAASPAPQYCTVVKKEKKKNISPSNFAEIVLSQIPGVSSTTAIAVMAEFGSMEKLTAALNTNPACLDEICTELNGKRRRIGKNVRDGIREFLLYSPSPTVI